jgi:hypothetical protein
MKPNKIDRLDGYTWQLPSVPEAEEWHRGIQELEGLTKKAAIARAQGYLLLKEIHEKHVTPERLGWVNLWAKTINALESAILAADNKSGYLLQAISRPALESFIHVLVIIDPARDAADEQPLAENVSLLSKTSKYQSKKVIERFQAYTAWCLWCDRDYYRRVLRDNDAIWDPQPAREYVYKNKSGEFDAVDLFTGKPEIELNEHKLKQGQAKTEKEYLDKIQRIDEWASDPSLAPWWKKIRSIPKKGDKFYQLFMTDGHMREVLQKNELDLAYLSYSRASQVLHGSSFEQFILLGDSLSAPRLPGFEPADNDDLYDEIISNSKTIFFLLRLTNGFAFRKD